MAASVHLQRTDERFYELPSKSLALAIERKGFVSSLLGTYSENQLILARFDATRNSWLPLPSTRDTFNKTVTAYTDHFSLFQIMGMAGNGDLTQITAGPNPLRLGMNPAQSITFRNCPAQARLRVYTPRGGLLRELRADAAGLAIWDGRNGSGRTVASGIYLVLIESSGSKKILNVAIER